MASTKVTISAPGRGAPEQINLQLKDETAAVRSAVMAVFNAAYDHSNGPTTIEVLTGNPGEFAVAVKVGKYVHGA